MRRKRRKCATTARCTPASPRSTRNPALELFVDILNRVAFLYFRDGSSLGEGTLSASRQAHARITEAVLDHDADAAGRRMRRHLEAESAFLQNRKLSRQYLPRSVALGGGVSNKRAEDVARAILQDVVADDLPPGTLLGSQATLIEKYGASRDVFREALRLLEHHQVATMRRGPGGGLFVSRAQRARRQRRGRRLPGPPRHLHGRPH